MPGLPLRALLLAGLLALTTASAASAASGADRLERFHELAESRLGLVEAVDAEAPPESFREIYAVLDDEIVDNLRAGGPFASLEFLQDRLDAFAEVWGGASLQLLRSGGLLIGAFTLDERAPANSLRVYGLLRGEPAVLTTLYREGRPSLHGGGADGAPVVVAWEGTISGWGTRPLRVEVLRRDADGMRVAWSTADVFPDELLVRTWTLRGSDLRVRYELHYPG